jgi:20S proteasome subunit beta 4
MECVIGIVGKDFVLLAADTNQAHSIVVMKQDEDKMIKLGSHSAMLVTGDPGDKVQFGEYIQRNLQLYKMVNGFELSTGASANYTRRELATSLRSRVSAVNGIRLCCSPFITDTFAR